MVKSGLTVTLIIVVNQSSIRLLLLIWSWGASPIDQFNCTYSFRFMVYCAAAHLWSISPWAVRLGLMTLFPCFIFVVNMLIINASTL